MTKKKPGTCTKSICKENQLALNDIINDIINKIPDMILENWNEVSKFCSMMRP